MVKYEVVNIQMAAKFIGKDILILKRDTKGYIFGNVLDINTRGALIESPYETTKWHPLDTIWFHNGWGIHRVKDLVKKSLKKKKMREKWLKKNLRKN